MIEMQPNYKDPLQNTKSEDRVLICLDFVQSYREFGTKRVFFFNPNCHSKIAHPKFLVAWEKNGKKMHLPRYGNHNSRL